MLLSLKYYCRLQEVFWPLWGRRGHIRHTAVVFFLFFCLCKTEKRKAFVKEWKGWEDLDVMTLCLLDLEINISNLIILHLMQPVNIVLNKCLLWSRYCELFSKSNIMLLKVCQFQNGLRQEDKEVEVISSYSRLVQLYGAVLCNIV